MFLRCFNILADKLRHARGDFVAAHHHRQSGSLKLGLNTFCIIKLFTTGDKVSAATTVWLTWMMKLLPNLSSATNILSFQFRFKYLHERQCHILWGMPPAASQLCLVRTRGTNAHHALVFLLWRQQCFAWQLIHYYFSILSGGLHQLAITHYLSCRISEKDTVWRPDAISLKTCRGGAARRNISNIQPVVV